MISIHSTMLSRFRHTLLIVPLMGGCVEDGEGEGEDFREASIAARMAFEAELSTLDDEDLFFIYREGSPEMEVVIDLARFAPYASDHTVDITARMVLPEGTARSVELSWTHSEDERPPRLELPMVGLGQYEVVIERLAIDGRVIAEGPVATHGMKILDGGGGATAASCGADAVIYGSDLPNILHGGGANDDIRGYGGDDYLYGYACHDTFRGGGGYDRCYGGGGVNNFYSCEEVHQP